MPAFACVAAAATLAGLPHTAAAIDLDNNADLITDTVASKEMRQQWTDSARSGARTVDQIDRGFAAPDGVRVGNFFWYPSISETVAYDSNIFGLDQDPIADWRFITTPSLTVQSQLPRHVLDMTVFGRFMNFAENTDQDYADFGGNVRGALHIDHAHTLSATVGARRLHEERNEITASQSAAEPVPVDEFKASVGITRDAGRVYATLAAGVQTLDFDSVPAIGGGTLNQDYRDQELYDAHIRGGYRISPGFDFVAKVRGLKQFNEPETPGLEDRNSTGYEIAAGLAFESDPLLRWRILGGYGSRNYDRADLANVSTSLLEAQLQWLASDRLTITANANRSIDDELGADDNGRIETAANISADYEIRHDLVGSINVGIADVAFIDSTRDDQVFEAGVSLQYFYTKNMHFSLGYTFESRDSNEPGFDLDRSIVRIGGKLQF